MNLSKSDFKQVFLAIVIAVGGALFWMWRKRQSPSPGDQSQSLNAQSAANGTAGAISPAGSVNTFNVFPPSQSAQQGPTTALYRNTGASSAQGSGMTMTNRGQTFPLPMNG